jgi:hypothetical protein
MQVLESINQKVADQFSRLLAALSAGLTPERFARLDALLGTVGVRMAPVTMLLLLAAGIVAGIKLDSFIAFAVSLGAIIAFCVAHWCGRALMANCDLAVANTSSRISAFGVFRTQALLAGVVLVALLAGGGYTAIKLSQLEPLYVPLIFAGGGLFLIWFLLHPALVGISEDATSRPGEDALSICSFAFVGSLRLHRVLFGVGLSLGNVSIAISIVGMMRGQLEAMFQTGVAALSGVIMVFSAALAPLSLYLVFVFYLLLVDLLRSVLRAGTRG